MTTMIQPDQQVPSPLYRATLELAALRGNVIMTALLAKTETALRARLENSPDRHVRDATEQSLKLLQRKESELRVRYPKALEGAFGRPSEAVARGQRSFANVQFDELELMDESQVQESVSVARVLQLAAQATQSSLGELNALLCTVLGLATVTTQINPLRPEAFITALKDLIDQLGVAAGIRAEWFSLMGPELVPQLHVLYRVLAEKLRSEGVLPAPFKAVGGQRGSSADKLFDSEPPVGASAQSIHAEVVKPGSPISAQPSAAPRAVQEAVPQARRTVIRDRPETLLTLDRLRSLLAGELELQASASRLPSFEQQFDREFGSPQATLPGTDFDATVPAALVALEELHQVDQVVQRIAQRRQAPEPNPAHGQQGIVALRERMRRGASGVAQALSLEVVTMMVDNLARDDRLLSEVRDFVRTLEPALLQLALVDPRFFTYKGHPARVLVHEITHRSLAYASTSATGFQEFFGGLQRVRESLMQATIKDADPFERLLATLREEWRLSSQRNQQGRDQAVEVLQHAEQRNLLAERISREIDAHPDASKVPEVVIDFLCGPWAQVVAQARMSGEELRATADKYQSLISALLWSTHPTLTRKKYAKLTRLVPLLLATLRNGLESIRYPATRTSAFLEVLMGLHQKAFREAQKPTEVVVEASPMVRASSHGRRVESGDPWVAPQEAQASNFIELPDSREESTQALVVDGPARQAHSLSPVVADGAGIASVEGLPLGSWVEMLTGGEWVRTQLTWASPHGTLFLFTSVFGTSQSMTRRTRDKMVACGNLRVISGEPVVQGALNAVAQQAMRNSVDTVY